MKMYTIRKSPPASCYKQRIPHHRSAIPAKHFYRRKEFSYPRIKIPLAESRAERGCESNIYLARASAHPCRAFFYRIGKGFSYPIKKACLLLTLALLFSSSLSYRAQATEQTTEQATEATSIANTAQEEPSAASPQTKAPTVENATEAPLENPSGTEAATENVTEITTEPSSIDQTTTEEAAPPSRSDTPVPDVEPEKIQVTEMSGAYYISASGGLNVRSGPSTSHKVIGSLPYGAKIHVTGITDNDWYRIDMQKEQGYISAEYVTDKRISSLSKDSDDTSEKDSEERTSEAGSDAQAEATHSIVSQLKAVVLLFVIGVVIIAIIATGIVFMKKERLKEDALGENDGYDEDMYDAEDDYDDTADYTSYEEDDEDEMDDDEYDVPNEEQHFCNAPDAVYDEEMDDDE